LTTDFNKRIYDDDDDDDDLLILLTLCFLSIITDYISASESSDLMALYKSVFNI